MKESSMMIIKKVKGHSIYLMVSDLVDSFLRIISMVLDYFTLNRIKSLKESGKTIN
jgi:hypothetical protein